MKRRLHAIGQSPLVTGGLKRARVLMATSSDNEDCISAADCSGTSRHTHVQQLSSSSWQQQAAPGQPTQAPRKADDAAHALEQLLQRALTDADTALHLTTNAMGLATHICGSGTSSAANAALTIAEQALAATMNQLAVAQALVARKAAQQQLLQCLAADDEELQDTCSSIPACA